MAKIKTKVPHRLPKPVMPDAALRQYYRHLHKYAQAYVRLARAGLKGALPQLRDVSAQEQPEIRSDAWRMDANIEKKIQKVLEDVEAELARQFPEALLRRWAMSMIGSVNKGEKKNMQRLAGVIGLDVEPLLHDRGLNPFFQNIIDENVGLIRSIPQERLAAFKNSLVAAVTADQTSDALQKIIQKHFNYVGVKPALIARDQIGKLNGKLNRYRQEQLGGKRYRWKGSMDSRERDSHLKLQDKIFKWDKPPVVDKKTGRRCHPGEDYQCRCRAEMIIEDVLD